MKNKSPKLTNRQIEYNLATIHNQLSQIAQVVDGIGNMMYKYIDYKGDRDGFQKHCEYQEPKETNEQDKET
tara:strand:+ start:402 stop:614 length:213 start_codon:yes stop_codon:yes gene_type:complete